jgi:hypothetical protein
VFDLLVADRDCPSMLSSFPDREARDARPAENESGVQAADPKTALIERSAPLGECQKSKGGIPHQWYRTRYIRLPASADSPLAPLVDCMQYA